MSDQNLHITEYLDYYLNSSNPDCAIMINGAWGCGKTWFIKNYIESKGAEKFLYCSLNGITTFKEIEDSFFQQIHPVLSSKKMKFLGKLAKGLLKTTIKIDLDNDGKENGTISSGIPDIDLPEYFKNTNERFLVFDDLERCSLPIYNILGYINQFVENDGLKVIIIANEVEIIEKTKEESEKSKNYANIKEKLIGRSFNISTNFELAAQGFITHINNHKTKSILTKNIGLLKDVFEEGKFNNLRHFKQLTNDFERFFKLLPDEANSNSDLLKHIISLFFSIGIEIKSGAITEDKIEKILNYNRFKDRENTVEDEIRNKYSILKYRPHPIDSQTLIQYFKTGLADKAKLKESIINCYYINKPTRPAWVKLWYEFEIEDDEFDKLFNEVLDEYRDLKIDDYNVVIQTLGILISFVDQKYLELDKNDLIEIGKKNISNIKAKEKLIIPTEIGGAKLTSSHGLTFQNLEYEGMRNFIEYVISEANSLKQEMYPKEAKALLDLLRISVDNFIEQVTLNNSTNNKYYDYPILKYIKPEDFINSYLYLSNNEKRKFGLKIEDRYKHKILRQNLTEEHKWLIECHKILSNHIDKDEKLYKVSDRIIRYNTMPTLEDCIKMFEGDINN